MKRIENLLLIFGICQVAFVLYFTFFTTAYVDSDFKSYLTGATILMQGKGYDLYNQTIQKQVQDEVTFPIVKDRLLFRALPITASLYIPFAFFNLKMAYYLMTAFNILLLLYFAYLAKESVGSYKIALALILSCYYLLVPLFQGQINILITLIIFIVYKLIAKKKYFWVGVFTAFLLIKVQFLVFAPLLFILSENKKRFVFGGLVSGLLLFFANILLSGVSLIYTYPKFVFGTEGMEFGNYYPKMYGIIHIMQTGVSLVISNPSTSHNISLAINLLMYLLVLILLGYLFKVTKNLEIVYALAAMLIPLFAIHVWGHDLGTYAISLILFCTQLKKFPKLIYMFGVLYLVTTLFDWAHPNKASLIYLLVGVSTAFYINKLHHLPHNLRSLHS